MEEKKAEQYLDELLNVSGSMVDKATTAFRQWAAEGLDAAGMFRRLTDIFDSAPEAAEKAFGGEYLDIVDYFTHYWG